jgi:hypothetical protein
MIELPIGCWCATVIEGLVTKVNTTEVLFRDVLPLPFYYHFCNTRVLDSFPRSTLEETEQIAVKYTGPNNPASQVLKLRYTNSKSCKKIRLSWYQPIDKNDLCFYVKFENRLSIPFARKMRSKKSGTFPNGSAFLQVAGVQKLKI